MTTLGFPIYPPGTNVGATYTIGSTTYSWNGYAWYKTNQGNINATTITGTTISLSTTSYIDGSIIITSATINQYVTQSQQGIMTILAGTDTAVSVVGNTATVWNTSTLESVTLRGNTTDQQIHITNDSNALSIDTGALTIAGGVGIGKDLWIGGTIYSNGHYVLTTSSFYDVVDSGPDILITATNAGVVFISDISTLESVTSRGSITDRAITLTNGTNSTSTTTGALVVKHGVAVGRDITIGGQINIGPAAEISSSQVRLNTLETMVIDSYSATMYRTSKYIIQIEVGTGYNASFQALELLLMVDNLGYVSSSGAYGVITSNGELGDFAAEVTGGLVELYFTPYATSATDTIIKILRTTMLW